MIRYLQKRSQDHIKEKNSLIDQVELLESENHAFKSKLKAWDKKKTEFQEYKHLKEEQTKLLEVKLNLFEKQSDENKELKEKIKVLEEDVDIGYGMVQRNPKRMTNFQKT
jgi:hypothetical protein